MIGVLVLTQGGAAHELVAAVQTIMGPLHSIEAISLPWESIDTGVPEVMAAIDRLDQGQGVLILTDMFGSRPSAIAKNFLETGRVEIVTAVNLPMLIRVSVLPEGLDLAQLADWICHKAQRSIVRMSAISDSKPFLPPSDSRRKTRSAPQARTRETACAELGPCSVFLSYRRDVSWELAWAILGALREEGYDVFLDTDRLGSGEYDPVIRRQIALRPHFLILLTEQTVERFLEPGDYLRREIELAITLKRNIVPILGVGFSFKAAAPFLTGKLKKLQRFNGLPLLGALFPESMVRLRNNFLKPPGPGGQ